MTANRQKTDQRSKTGASRKRAPSGRRPTMAARRRRRLQLLLGAIVATAAVAVVLIATSGNGSGASATDVASATVSGPAGPEGIPLQVGTPLAPLPSAPNGNTVDGVQCNGMEQAVQHIHAHVAVFVDGTLRPIPGGVGIVAPVAEQTDAGPIYAASTCYYWLHTHAQDGIVHIESPTQATYTLGQFFAIWGEPISATQVGPANGTVTTFVNGVPYHGDPADISLAAHEDIQIDVGTPAPTPERIAHWPTGL